MGKVVKGDAWTKCAKPRGELGAEPSCYELCECGHNAYWHTTAGCNHPDCLIKKETPTKGVKYVNPFSSLGVGKRVTRARQSSPGTRKSEL